MKLTTLEPCDLPQISSSINILSAKEAPPCLDSTMKGQRESTTQQTPEEEEEENNQKGDGDGDGDDDDDLVLDLSLSSKESDRMANPELNLIESLKATNSSPRGGGNDEAEPRVFSCNYCQRKFYSSQALGGHQNAHKRERTLAKRGQIKIGHDHEYSYPQRYSSLASLPLHGSFNRSLGIQAHSTIHKPTNYLPSNILISSTNSHVYRHHGWSRKPIDQQQPAAVGRLAPAMNYHVGTSVGSSLAGGGAARFDGVRRFSGDIIGGYRWDNGSTHLKANQDELQKLDLSLKL